MRFTNAVTIFAAACAVVPVAAADETSLVRSDSAVILFDGTDAGAWRHKDGGELQWNLVDGALEVKPASGNAISRATFEDFSLHLEFMCPNDDSPGNSGIYIFGTYEVQIFNSWEQEAKKNGCGALYNFKAPDTNAALAPGKWQSYDIDFVAPRWSETSEKISEARITVRHNGVLVHKDVRLTGPTGAGSPELPGAGGGPIVLQDHGDRVRFRNIRIVPHKAWEGASASGFTSLFGGASLNGWRQLGGKAAYSVEDGAIIGETRPSEPNSFLCTDHSYDDFVLELEFKVDRELNSGIQIRSRHDEAKNRVRGYQVEIDPSERAWSAGVYEEGARGWLHPLDNNERARTAFRQEDWNRLRIIARRNTIRTYLNGVPAAVLVDMAEEGAASGFIGLQVHGVGNRADPLRVRWRDIRIRTLD